MNNTELLCVWLNKISATIEAVTDKLCRVPTDIAEDGPSSDKGSSRRTSNVSILAESDDDNHNERRVCSTNKEQRLLRQSIEDKYGGIINDQHNVCTCFSLFIFSPSSL